MEKVEKPQGSLPPDASEFDALTAIVTALKPFQATDRLRIVDAAMVLLGSPAPAPRDGQGAQPVPAPDSGGLPLTPRDIRHFKEMKDPKTGLEMAALVAYYLAKHAPTDRRDSITSADIKTFFEQAAYPLPTNPSMTLVNGKAAGYFDSLGEGKYRLNPVGLNLVAHGLPRKADGSSTPRRRKPARRTAKPARPDKKAKKKSRLSKTKKS